MKKMSKVNLPFDPSDEKGVSKYAAQNADTANFISKGWYYYTWPMFQQARRKMCLKQPLNLGDTFLLTKDENVKDASESFHKFLAEDIAEARKEGGAPLDINATLKKAFGADMRKGAACRFLSDTSIFITPWLVQLITNFMTEKQPEEWQGYVWATCLFLAVLFFAKFQIASLGFSYRYALNSRTALMSAIFQRTLRLSSVEDTGDILRMYSTDCQKMIDMAPYLQTMWAAPLLLVIYIILLCHFIGWAGVIGFAVIVVSLPFQGMFMGKMIAMKMVIIQLGVQRVRATSEAFQAMRLCKFLSMEDAFYCRIDKIRKRELGFIYLF